MDVTEALQVADKAADRNTPAREHPSLVHMIYALEILADGHRTYREKAVAWEGTAERLGRELEDANEELDRTQGAWSDLMEFIRAALNLDVRALDDPGDVRKILGHAFADARLWARVKELAAGNFRAGDVVTADALNAFSEAFNEFGNAARDGFTQKTMADGKEPWTPPGFTHRIHGNSVYMAPEGTDPKDWKKWTHIGWAKHQPKLVFEGPAAQEFPAGSPEPPGRVAVVECHLMCTPLRFVRVAQTVNGDSLWRPSDRPSTTELWMWKDITEEPCREVLPQ